MSNDALPAPLQSVIDAKAGSIRSLRLEWDRCVRLALSSGIDADVAAELASRFSRPRYLEEVIRSAGRFGEELGELCPFFTAEIDELPVSSSEWFDAYEAVQDLLMRERRNVNPRVIAGFLNCCVEFSAGNEAKMSLRETTLEMIKTYGFEG